MPTTPSQSTTPTNPQPFDSICAFILQFSDPNFSLINGTEIAPDEILDHRIATSHSRESLRTFIIDELSQVAASGTHDDHLCDLADAMQFSIRVDANIRHRITRGVCINNGLKRIPEDQRDYIDILVDTSAIKASHRFLGNNYNELYQAQDLPPNTIPTPPTTTTPSVSVNTTIPTLNQSKFDTSMLPRPVHDRYLAYQNPAEFTPLTQLTDYTHNPLPSKFYADVSAIGDHVILLNGSVLHHTYDSKNFHRHAPQCPSASPSSIRHWYSEFQRHALACGLYLPPYELIDRTKGHDGFHYGVDIPTRLRVNHPKWSRDIITVLRTKGMFPDDSLMKSIALHTTNGYQAIITILSDTHPNFVDEPYLLCNIYPKQREHETIHDFYLRWIDTVQLRKIFFDDNTNITSIHHIADFIYHLRHSKWIFSVSHRDRRDPTKNHLFMPGQLPITIQTYLRQPNSPTEQTQVRYQRQIIHDQTANHNDILSHDSTEIIVDRLAKSDDKAIICGICGKQHRYSNCPTLQDSPPHVRHLLIQMTRQCQRLNKQSNTYKTNDTATDQPSTIHAVQQPQSKNETTTPQPDFH